MKVTYQVCPKCDFISKDEVFYLPQDTEKERYLTHQDSNKDDYYLNAYQNMIDSYIKPLKTVKDILEFGSGQYQTLVRLLENDGYNVTDYDLFFKPDLSYKNKKYDMITTTEVIEHIKQPKETIEELLTLINDKGYLLIMTNYREMDNERFLTWWYRRDRTHVGFYNETTFRYFEEVFNLKIVYNNHKNIIVFQKN